MGSLLFIVRAELERISPFTLHTLMSWGTARPGLARLWHGADGSFQFCPDRDPSGHRGPKPAFRGPPTWGSGGGAPGLVFWGALACEGTPSAPLLRQPCGRGRSRPLACQAPSQLGFVLPSRPGAPSREWTDPWAESGGARGLCSEQPRPAPQGSPSRCLWDVGDRHPAFCCFLT